MGIRLALLAFTLLLTAQGGVPDAWADELVQIASRRAATQPDTSGNVSPLLGFLARPNGRGRFPAVILLHGCIGFTDHETLTAATLKTWGYVALALDSLGGVNRCGGDASLGAAAAMRDAEAAFRYLAAQRFVASDRVALMGWSMGATAALVSVEKDKSGRGGQPDWRGVVAYYPDCGASSGTLTAPALVLVGERDDWAPAASCRKLAAHESDIGVRRDAAGGTPIDLVVYPDATHAFDYKFLPPRYMGHVVRHDEAVSRDAEMRVHAFLRDLLGDQPDKP
jgi:dienelactone hydrolase